MTQHYRVGIIGLSGIAASAPRPAPHPSLGTDTPYSHASAYARLPNCTVAAVCELSAERTSSFLDNWKSTWPEVKAYDDAGAMFREANLDLVSVATPDHLHKPFVLQACEAGAKGILCEKPLATSLADCDDMIRTVEQAGVAMNVECTRRWLGSWQDAKAAIQSGAIGEVKHIFGYLGGPRAMLYRNGTHIIDLINFFADADPVWVSAELEDGFEHFKSGYRGDGGKDPASEPGANAAIAYDNGVRATYIGMKGSFTDASLTVIGENGKIEVDGKGEVVVSATKDGIVLKPLQLNATRTRREYQYSGISGAVVDLIRAIESDQPTLSPPREARKTVAVTAAILESHFNEGRRIHIKDLPGDVSASA